MVDPRWRKSSRSSGSNSSQCVEVANLIPAIGVRDSKHLDSGVLTVPHNDWIGLVASVKSNQFDSR
ncbi:DUF397 domain-containing protein [Stackebrandtia nassauensis]|uniref:DUF397 domain-containing protein n=1 Tax=Stackebrandtia nassauensis (strain DSM 44728 / CIP 108903 / NRRL B-16338 / NBRC 102104 / LLR-40K-21) TaxID=446470 RepID=D3PV14_STANL|nr:DUF397 domain-containing protein [Stackebrandtia nassauensis]ADD45038.1 protein of unknown function DUF397 [Stackebrandtia nassauensis DSM 44728]